MVREGNLKQKKKMKDFTTVLKVSSALAIAILVGIWPALYNAFPLLNPDSGAYIAHAFISRPPIDRSVFYSYFIRASSLMMSPMWCVVVQSGIGTSLVFLLLRQHFPAVKAGVLSLVSILILSGLTPYAWFVSQLNPDIFMAYFVLAVLGLMRYTRNSKGVNAYFILIIFIAASIHNSILLLCLLWCLAGIIYAFWKRARPLRNRLLLILTGTIAIYCLAANINYNVFRVFSPNPSGHVFLMSRIAEMGLLKEVLKEECAVKNYEICKSDTGFNGRQWDFMWQDGWPHSGGRWLEPAVKKEYESIVSTTLTSGKYLKRYMAANIKDAFFTLFETNVDDGIHRFGENTSPWNNVRAFYPQSFPAFQAAGQQKGAIDFPLINQVTRWGMLVLLVVTACMYLAKDRQNGFRNSYIILAATACCCLNIFITTSLSTYLGRFNARVIWVLPFSFFLAYLQARDAVSRKRQLQ